MNVALHKYRSEILTGCQTSRYMVFTKCGAVRLLLSCVCKNCVRFHLTFFVFCNNNSYPKLMLKKTG